MERLDIKKINDSLTKQILDEMDQNAIVLFRYIFDIKYKGQDPYFHKDIISFHELWGEWRFGIGPVDDELLRRNVCGGEIQILKKWTSFIYHPPKYEKDFIYESKTQHIDYKDFINKISSYFREAVMEYYPNLRSKPRRRIQKQVQKVLQMGSLYTILEHYKFRFDLRLIKEILASQGAMNNFDNEILTYGTIGDIVRTPGQKTDDEYFDGLYQEKIDHIKDQWEDIEKAKHQIFSLNKLIISERMLTLLKMKYFIKFICSKVDVKSLKVLKKIPRKSEKNKIFVLFKKDLTPRWLNIFGNYDKKKDTYEDAYMETSMGIQINNNQETLDYIDMLKLEKTDFWIEFTLRDGVEYSDIQYRMKERLKADVLDKYQQYFKNRDEYFKLKDTLQSKKHLEKLNCLVTVKNHEKEFENDCKRIFKLYEAIDGIYKVTEKLYFEELHYSDKYESYKHKSKNGNWSTHPNVVYLDLKYQIDKLKKDLEIYNNTENVEIKAAYICKWEELSGNRGLSAIEDMINFLFELIHDFRDFVKKDGNLNLKFQK